jgi:hypothetical protein
MIGNKVCIFINLLHLNSTHYHIRRTQILQNIYKCKQLYNKITEINGKAFDADRAEGIHLIKNNKLYKLSITVWPAAKNIKIQHLKSLSYF